MPAIHEKDAISTLPPSPQKIASLLKRLSRQGNRLTPERARSGELRYQILSVRGKRLGLASADLVQDLLRRDLLREGSDGLTLSSAGAAWLRRHLAGGDAYRSQHAPRQMEQRQLEGCSQPVPVMTCESPLGWLRRRKGSDGRPLISLAQFEAGERLRADFWRAQMTPNVTANWGLPASSRRTRRSANDHAKLAEHVVAARQRVDAALQAVGPELSGILIDVCCHLMGLEAVERNRGWPRRSGKVVLGLALARLARHYGLMSETVPPKTRKHTILHWGTADFRPSL